MQLQATEYFEPDFAAAFTAASSTAPIDVVLPWVDGSDPEWQKQKRTIDDKLAGSRFLSDPACRYRAWGMIDYCLTGLLKHAPWVRQIFLVTFNQRPADIDRIQAVNKNIPIKVVNHCQFIPEKYLPAFNIYSIGSFFHRIPDLSEIFLYIEDDMFFFAPTLRSDFLSDDGRILIRKPSIKTRDEIRATSICAFQYLPQLNNFVFKTLDGENQLLRGGLSDDSGKVHYYRTLDQTDKLCRTFCEQKGLPPIYEPPHFPSLYLKAGFEFAERHWPLLVERTRRNKVRRLGDVCTWKVAHNFAYAQGLTRIHLRREIYVSIGRNVTKLRRALGHSKRFSVVCLNDIIIGDEPINPEIETMVETYLKLRSSAQSSSVKTQVSRWLMRVLSRCNLR